MISTYTYKYNYTRTAGSLAYIYIYIYYPYIPCTYLCYDAIHVFISLYLSIFHGTLRFAGDMDILF